MAKFLDSEATEGKSLDEVAKAIVEGYLDALSSKIVKPAQPLRLGMLFKHPADGRVRRVAWVDDTQAWIVTDNASYGWLGTLLDPVWQVCEEYRPKRRVDGKMVEMTDDDVAEQWANPEWQVGDRASINQRQHTFEVIATGPACVLMVGSDGKLISDSNSNLARYYRRELKVGGVVW